MGTQATTPPPLPFPASGRPLFFAPRPHQVVAVVFCVLILLGMPPATAGDGHPRWQAPVTGGAVEEFAAPPAPWASGHRGVDLGVPAGGEIRAPADGVVSFSGVVVDREVLSIEHGGGYISSFEPVDSELTEGDTVSEGDVVAVLGTYDGGATHCEDQSCLHWGVRLHGEYINPMLLIEDLEPSVLLPLND